MVNKIKESADGLALQVTREARSAELIEENNDGECRYRADVRVFSFPGLLLVVDREKIDPRYIVDLVTTTAKDIGEIGPAADTTITLAGNGYQIQLPPATKAGFHEGDKAPCRAMQNALLIRRSESALDHQRLIEDIVSIRQDQAES